MYRLLSIEDDPAEEAALRELVERYATSHNVELDLAWERSSFDFVGAETHYDLVFLDIDLPGINGMETAALLRGYDSQTPIIFVTNNIEEACYLGDRIVLLSDCPAKVKEEYPIDLPRPRDMVSKEFMDLRTKISDNTDLSI